MGKDMESGYIEGFMGLCVENAQVVIALRPGVPYNYSFGYMYGVL